MSSVKLIRIMAIGLVLFVFGSWLFFLESNTLDIAPEIATVDLELVNDKTEYAVDQNKLYYFTSDTAYIKVISETEDDTVFTVETNYYEEFGQLFLSTTESEYRNYTYNNFYYHFTRVQDSTIYGHLYNNIIEDLSKRTIGNYDLVIYPTITINVSEANRNLIITQGRGV